MVWQWLVIPLVLVTVAAAPPAGTLAVPTQSTETWEIPAPLPSDDVHRVRMEPPPSEAAGAAFATAVAQMDGVRGDLVLTQGRADILVRWVHELQQGNRLGQHVLGTPRIDVALGDSRCAGGWTPYDEATLRRVVAHEIGHAIGLQHGKGIMSADLPVSYAEPCVHREATARLLPLQVLSAAVRTGSTESLSYEFSSRGAADACITPAATTQMEGWACRATDGDAQVTLPAGSYKLAIRCLSPFGCDVAYRFATEPTASA